MNTQLIFSLISGVFIAGVSGYLGGLMLSKKMSVVVGPLAHLAFPGVALALLLGINLGWGVFPLIVIAAIIIWLIEQKTELPMENLAAIVFASGVGIGLLFLPIDKAEEALTGTIGQISARETVFIVLLSSFLFLLIHQVYDKLMLMNVDYDLALTSGVKIKKINLIYLLAISAVVSLGVYLVGGLITAALAALPAAIAKNLSSDLKKYKLVSILAGSGATALSILFAFHFHLPVGPIIILGETLVFLFSLFLMPKIK